MGDVELVTMEWRCLGALVVVVSGVLLLVVVLVDVVKGMAIPCAALPCIEKAHVSLM